MDDEKDHEEESVLGRPSIWVGTHTIYYRAAQDAGESSEATSSKASSSAHVPPLKSAKKSQTKRNKDSSSGNCTCVILLTVQSPNSSNWPSFCVHAARTDKCGLNI